MKLRLLAATTVLMAASLPTAAAVDVGVSIEISQPGVYGRVDIGRFPQPQLIVAQPVIVSAPRVIVARPQPVYMWVPREHRKNWRRHCAAYGACAAPVVFVRHDWYDGHVRPNGKDHGKAHAKGHGKSRHQHGRHD